MILLLSWRNVWRNKKRSFIIIIAIAFGMWAGLFTAALMNGMVRQKIEDDVATQYSHVQIHKPHFRDRRDMELVIPNGQEVFSHISQLKGAKAATARSILKGMATSPTTAVGVMIYGIDPTHERQVTNMYKKVIEGSYFESDKRNPAIIGKKLADELKVNLNNKIVLNTQDASGDISAGAYRIVGIYKTVSSMYDGMVIFTQQEDLDRNFLLDGNIHEIALLADDYGQLDSLGAQLSGEFPDLEVLDWKELSPELNMLVSATDQWNQIFMIIIMLALVFSLTNTMLMGVLERIRELGMVMALEMKHSTIFVMIALETIMLALVGGAAGIALNVATVEWLAREGLDLSIFSTTMESFGYAVVVYPSLVLKDYPPLVVLLFITALAAAIYPGVKAVKLKPVEAIRTY